MEDKAQAIVHNYIINHLDKSDGVPKFEVYTVWKCKALQNWKFLISSSLLDGMYYELTFNGDKGEWYLDAYKKFENQVIRENTADTPQVERQRLEGKRWTDALTTEEKKCLLDAYDIGMTPLTDCGRGNPDE